MRTSFTLLAAVALSALRHPWPRSIASLVAAERRVGQAAETAALSAAKLNRLLSADAGSEQALVKMGAELAHTVVPNALAVVVGTFAEAEDGERKAAGREVAWVELRGPDAALLDKLRVRRTFLL